MKKQKLNFLKFYFGNLRDYYTTFCITNSVDLRKRKQYTV